MSGVSDRRVAVCYFASVRERVGVAREEIMLPAEVVTVADLIAYLKGRSEAHGRAFASPQFIRAALDQVHAKPEARLGSAREVAFFPPVTGG